MSSVSDFVWLELKDVDFYRNLFRERINENLKLKKQNEDMESQLLVMKNELNASKDQVKELEVNC